MFQASTELKAFLSVLASQCRDQRCEPPFPVQILGFKIAHCNTSVVKVSCYQPPFLLLSLFSLVSTALVMDVPDPISVLAISLLSRANGLAVLENLVALISFSPNT